jgi:hypothetical protein
MLGCVWACGYYGVHAGRMGGDMPRPIPLRCPETDEPCSDPECSKRRCKQAEAEQARQQLAKIERDRYEAMLRDLGVIS